MLSLWETPYSSRAEARAAFGTVYAEQMSLNGQPLSLDSTSILAAATPALHAELLALVAGAGESALRG